MVRLIIVLFFIAFSWSLQAQCQCDYTLDSSATALNNDTVQLKPGDTLCIAASTKKYLTLLNFQGNADSSIVAINCSGKVILEATDSVYYQQGINLHGCTYFQLTGTGHVGTTYGFQISRTYVGSGLDARYGSTNLEIDHLEVSETNFAGLIIKDDPKCNGDYTRSQFTMRDIRIHDNYIHNTSGEGIYVGVTAYDGFSKDCSGDGIVDTLLSGHEIIGVYIYDNVLDSVGREGIQVFSAPRNVSIHHNTVTNYSVSKQIAHSSAIQLGNGCSGEIYSNSIKRGFGSGIHVSADSTVSVRNNIIDQAGMMYDTSSTESAVLAYGIYLWEDRIRNSGTHFGIFNNTIVCSKNNGIKQYGCGSSSSKTIIAHNNVILKPGLHDQSQATLIAPLSFDCSQNVTESHNFYDSSLANVGLVNPGAGDFNLSNTSFLINQGTSLTAYGVNTDYRDSLRPVDSLYDLGAYEHQAPSSTLDSFPGFNPEGCDFVLYPTGNTIDGNNYTYKNGDAFCLVAGDWLPIKISNFHGSVDSPITFRNYLGRINITGTYGINLSHSSNLTIAGDGDANTSYGFKIQSPTGDGIDINLSTHFEIHHVAVDSAGNNAIKNQDKPCDYSGDAARTAFEQKNCSIHHNKFSNTQGSNTIVVGNVSHYYNAQGSCGLSYQNKSFAFFNNLFENNEGTGLYLSCTDSNAQVYANTFKGQTERCLYLDKGSFANIYGNSFETKNTTAIRINEGGHQYIHNNIFKGMNTGLSNGIEFRPPASASSFIRKNVILNNTMVLDTASKGIYFYDNSCDTSNTNIANNIIIIPAATGTLPSPYIKLAKTHGANYQNNLMLNIVDSAYFNNAVLCDFELTASSPAIDAGIDLSNDTFKVDYTLQPRPDTLVEIGAYQYIAPASKKQHQQRPKHQQAPSLSTDVAQVSLFPNPSKDQIKINGWTFMGQRVSVLGTTGKTFYCEVTEGTVINISKLPEGMYALQIPHSTIQPEYLFFVKL